MSLPMERFALSQGCITHPHGSGSVLGPQTHTAAVEERLFYLTLDPLA